MNRSRLLPFFALAFDLVARELKQRDALHTARREGGEERGDVKKVWESPGKSRKVRITLERRCFLTSHPLLFHINEINEAFFLS